jgi:hypothetical protein
MTKIQIEVPDVTAQAAEEAGLLTPQAMERLLSNALRKQQAADYLLAIASEITAANIPTMTAEEIQAEINAARTEKKQRADHH